MTAMRVKCPTCGRPTEWSEAAAFRPFCSERCRLIDLGAWLSEQRAIPGASAADPTSGCGSDTPASEEASLAGQGHQQGVRQPKPKRSDA